MPSDTRRQSCLTREDALDFLAGRLPTDREIEIDNHVQQCPECSDHIDRLSDDSDLRNAFHAHQRCRGRPQLSATLSEFREELYALSGSAVSDNPDVLRKRTPNEAKRNDFQHRPQQPSRPTEFPKRLGRFAIARLLGRGGFGVVYLADDTLLHRQVALKIPRMAALDDPQHRARFLREGRATAGLHHPHILPVYEAGEIGGLCYLASMYCSGPTLAVWLCKQKRPVVPGTAAHIVTLLADALEHAHQRRVLHRDVKPGNVLLDTTRPCGPLPFTPLLADFGLAKLIDANLTVTASNALVGTPRYMAPEQAMGRAGHVGPATDVYALGTVLYELLTGTVPIAGGDNADTLRRLLTDLPASPRRQCPDIPLDLEAICLKCLEKSPEHRYATATELAADLRRFLTGTPTLARPIPIPAHLWRWTKRHPGPASVLLTLAIATFVIWTLILVNSRRIDTANINLRNAKSESDKSRRRSEQNAQQAERSEQRARQFLYAADISLAARSGRQGDVQQMLALLNRHRPASGEPDFRGFEWYFLYRSAHMEQRILLRCRCAVYRICFSPNGRLFAAAGEDGLVRVCDGRTFQIRLPLKTEQGEVNGVVFSPDGRELATAGKDGTVRVWDAATGIERLKIAAFRRQAYGVVYTPDGKRLITCGQNPAIRLWNRRTGQAAGNLKGHSSDVESLAVSPDGHLLASASRDHSVRLWDLDSKTETAVVSRRATRFSGVAFSPDGQQIADASLDGLADICEVSSRRHLTNSLQHFDGVHSVSFSPDGKLLATGDRAGVARIWKIADHLITSSTEPARPHNAPLRFWPAHTGRLWSLTFSPDGNELITAGSDGLVKAWSLKSLTEDNSLPTRPGELLRDFAFLPSGRLVTVGNQGVVSWNLATRKRSCNFGQSNEDEWNRVASSRDGRWVAAGSRRGLIRLWNTATRTSHAEWKFEKKTEVLKLRMAPDGKLLAAGTDDHLWVFELPTFRLLTEFPSSSVNAINFSPDSHQLAIENSTKRGSISIWDVARQQRIRILAGHRGTVRALAYSPDGRLLVSGGDDRLIKIWPLNRKTAPVVLASHRGRLNSAAFSPDGRSLITIGRNWSTPDSQANALKIWHTATGTELVSRPDDLCLWAAVSPDGCSLVLEDYNDHIRVIDVSPLAPRTKRH